VNEHPEKLIVLCALKLTAVDHRFSMIIA